MNLNKISQIIYTEFLIKGLIGISEPLIKRKNQQNITIKYFIKEQYWLELEINLNNKIINLKQIFINKKFRNKKNGRMMMELCEKIGKKLNIKFIIVLKNHEKTFYEHFNYKIIPRQLYELIIESFNDVEIKKYSVYKSLIK